VTTRPTIFKWRQTEPAVILCAVRWYLRYSLSLRDVEELLLERGLAADHTTVWRWVQRYGPELELRIRRHLEATNNLFSFCLRLVAVVTSHHSGSEKEQAQSCGD